MKCLNIKKSQGLSMVEMMITVVVVAVCLVLVIRVFSICAATVSKAYSTGLAVDVLQDKMDELQEEAILEDGVMSSSSTEDITVGNRKFALTEEIIKWKEQKESSESEGEEETAERKDLPLRQVNLGVSWKSFGRIGELRVETIIPAKGFRHEF